MEINDLVVLHFIDNKSDKVWGHFWSHPDKQYYKFWGRRTGKKFQSQKSNYLALSSDHDLKKLKEYVNGTSHVFNQVKATLEIQFGITQFKSVVTKEKRAIADAIKPSQVHKTVQVWDDGIKGEIICFYDKKGSSLGKRPVSQRNQIFDHLKKTKEPEFIIEPPKGELETIIWNKMKSPPKTK